MSSGQGETKARDTESREEKNRFLESTKEDIKLYQYWYSGATINAILAECEQYATKVAFLSTPSVYFSLCEGVDMENGVDARSILARASCVLDYDRAFQTAKGYVFFNYKDPGGIPKDLHHTFDFVVIDPPSVRDDVLAQYAKAARLLLCDGGGLGYRSDCASNTWLPCCLAGRTPKVSNGSPTRKGRILVTSLAGDDHAKLMYKLFRVKPCVFLPTIPNLIYQYHLYVNYESPRLAQINPDQPLPDPKKTSARSRLKDFGT
mmetsp:Transcript_27341/g.48344  ORF Transcript_27341/g.48344 Transcript_27341/m.48344 type:complete len:262 (+) Transcript_27341:88-873(+)|eukprot:CAMPEP_0197527454 /NCGR_PEP_ID=MMETSP1318-20131121/21728_1 /TAXON_ID=552666 /ORGANISM="Partenskyella glossopodia, Strain RCC365" /LENGTH=261 /DNA_ID=CAMNT_0043082113 /DNA_START=74 /DNA_END=859 /DNA_ORIENTATION=-